jgi:hypothetical protein
MAHGMAHGDQWERVAVEDTQSHSVGGVEVDETSLGVREARRYAKPATVGADLVAVTEGRLERPRKSIQPVVVQRMVVQESEEAVVVVLGEQTSIALGLRPHRYLVPSSSDTSGTGTM